MLVRVNDTNEVNTDHVVAICQPNANLPDQFVIQLTNSRQLTTDADGVDRIRAALQNNVNIGARVRGRMDAAEFGAPGPCATTPVTEDEDD